MTIEQPTHAVKKVRKQATGAYVFEDDLFTITATGFCKIRSIIQFLESPFFSLKPSMEHLTYLSNDGMSSIVVTPSIYGLPTVWDKDFLVYLISHIQNQLDDPLCDFDRFSSNHRYRFEVIELLRNIGRPPKRFSENSKLWNDMLIAGHRLRSSTIETTVKFGGNTVTSGSGFVQEFTLFHDGDTDKMYFIIHLTDWIYRAIMSERSREILSLDSEYFSIPNGLKRRIYEIIRQKMGVYATNGNQPRPYKKIRLEEFQLLTGSTTARITDFKAQIKEVFAQEIKEKIDSDKKKQKYLSGYAFDFFHWTITVYKDHEGYMVSIVNPKRVAELNKSSSKQLQIGMKHAQMP